MRPSTTRMALICIALVAVTSNAASAADVTMPVLCGSSGCKPLPTATLQGLLTLPDALATAESPPAQPFFLFRAEGLDGAAHEVVYVPHEDGALLGFAGGTGWRLVPSDDARLLADAVRGRTPYPAPAAGTRLGRLFTGEQGGWSAGWRALTALAGVAVLGCVVYVSVRTASRRTR